LSALFKKTNRLMESRQHMLAGIALMEEGEWKAALSHFECAIELREALPWREDVESAWLLAAGWINRSDVLRFLGDPEKAIHSLDRAIEAMNFVRLDENPGCANRLILAWVNRGTACGEARRMDESLEGFCSAENLLEQWGGPTTPDRKLMGSMLHANRARVLLAVGRIAEGWQDSQTAVSLLEGLEPAPVVTEAAIKSRGILCQALALMLDEPCGTGEEVDWIARATDSVEEALAMARESSYRGAWIADLVRYGARIYRICQPQFLGEFVREWMDSSSPLSENHELKRELANELLLGRADLERRVRRNSHETERVQRAVTTLLSLQLAEAELAMTRG
jgi:tetratricopeptide (TPR) repeat protein